MMVESAPDDPDAKISPTLALELVHRISARIFPKLVQEKKK
jgi:hypothetical protein